MNKAVLTILVIVVVAVGAGVAVWRVRGSDSGRLRFEEVIDNVDQMRNTELHTREYWRKHQNEELVTSGTVVDVKPKGRQSEVIVVNKARTAPRGFNLVLIVPDVARAAELRKNQFIRFRGILSDYRGGEGRGTALYLVNAEILK